MPRSLELAGGKSHVRTQQVTQGGISFGYCRREASAVTPGGARQSGPRGTIAWRGHRGGVLPPALAMTGRRAHQSPGTDHHRSREMFHVEREAGIRASRRAHTRPSTRMRPGPLPRHSHAPGPESPPHTPRIGRPLPARTCRWRRAPQTRGADLRRQGTGPPGSRRRSYVRLRSGPQPHPGSHGRAELRP